MGSTLFAILDGLREPADALLDPSKRVFAPALCGSLIIAAALLFSRGVALRKLPGRLFSSRIWLHKSARADYQMILAKALLRVLLLSSLGMSTLAVAALSAGWLRRHAGAPGLPLDPLWLGGLFTLSAFLIDDWSRFFMHRLMHRVPLLWEFHKVHHSAEVLTPFTLYRTHPIEALLNGVRGAMAVGLLTGLFAWLFGPGLRVFEVLGVELIGFVWTLFGANLRHSHVWVSYGGWLEHLLVSPAQHQIHHSRDARHLDRNFGTILAIWDWLGGSLYVTTKKESIHFGLPEGEVAMKQNLGDLLFLPVATATRGLFAWPRLRPVVATTLLAACLLSSGCSETKRLDRTVLLKSFGQCSLDSYKQAQSAAEQLVSATEALASTPTEATQTAARAAFAKAIDAWQVSELLRYGPAADFLTPGGKGLRDSIYSWPDVNRCLLETQLVAKSYEGAGFQNFSTNTRGLGALEYLLFYSGANNGCNAQAEINMNGNWAALGADELARRRTGYARVAAADVAQKLRDLSAAWEPNGFMAQLTGAGLGSTLFPTQQAAISAVAEAAFFLDTEVKDLKLALPLGIKNCASASCPEALESPFADRGKQHLHSNLVGLRLLLEGCPAGMSLGFDDLLESVGVPALASKMRDDLNAADAAVAALPGDSLKQALSNDRASVQRVYDGVKELTDFLKMEFSMALAIASKRVEGDHD